MRTLLYALCFAGLMAMGGQTEYLLWDGGALPAATLHELSFPGGSLACHRLSAGRKAEALLFSKQDAKREFAGFSFAFDAAGKQFRSLSADIFLKCDSGVTCRWLVLLEEQGGGQWVRMGERLVPGENANLQGTLEVGDIRELGFSRDDNGHLDWKQVRRLTVGVAIDGKGKGEVVFSRFSLREPGYRATEPLDIPLDVEAVWEAMLTLR